MRKHLGPWALAAAMAWTGAAGAAQPDQARQDVSSRQVVAAVGRGLEFLKGRQKTDGGWPEWSPGQYQGGTTALALLAMLTAGASPDDAHVAAGLTYLQGTPNTSVYAVSLKCQVYSLLGPSYRKALQDSAGWLAQRQGTTGLWNYGHDATLSSGDRSNTQFALLGLHMAQVAGVNIPAEIWKRSLDHFVSSQLADGGWNYNPGNPRKDGYGSMTVAGIASLYISIQHLAEKSPGHVFVNGRYVDCGKFDQSSTLQGGLAWLDRNFSGEDNPNGENRWLYYYLYGLERVGMISGLRFLGPHDWYRQGCRFLVRAQQGDGSWTGYDQAQGVVDTAFAVLFLAKGNRPVVIQKLQWNGQWDRNINDLENLTAAMGDKLGKPVSWQNTNLAVPLPDLLEAPLMVITGHEFPQFDDQQRRKIREYVENGGTILAEACCGSPQFASGFQQFIAQTFPEARLRPLPADHPVFHSYYEVADTYGLEGLGGGCRTSVFFSPRALSALWQLRDIPHYSELAFQLGANLISYAMGDRQLGTRLEPGPLPEVRPASRPADAPPGAVQIATLLHEGDFNPDPHAMANLAVLIKNTVGMDVVPQSPIVKPQDKDLFGYPVVFMTGHFNFELPPEGIENLRHYLQNGGILVTESCCGSKEFDAAFRKMAQQLFPDKPLTALPPNHPIFSGQVGVRLGQIQCRKVLADELGSPTTLTPPLEAVSDKGRAMILYSPYDFSCALEGDNPPSCRGYADESGQRLAVALFLFAMGF